MFLTLCTIFFFFINFKFYVKLVIFLVGKLQYYCKIYIIRCMEMWVKMLGTDLSKNSKSTMYDQLKSLRLVILKYFMLKSLNSFWFEILLYDNVKGWFVVQFTFVSVYNKTISNWIKLQLKIRWKICIWIRTIESQEIENLSYLHLLKQRGMK